MGHVLEEPRSTVMFAGLGCVVEVSFLLNRGNRDVRDRGYTSEPLDTPVLCILWSAPDLQTVSVAWVGDNVGSLPRYTQTQRS